MGDAVRDKNRAESRVNLGEISQTMLSDLMAAFIKAIGVAARDESNPGSVQAISMERFVMPSSHYNEAK